MSAHTYRSRVHTDTSNQLQSTLFIDIYARRYLFEYRDLRDRYRITLRASDAVCSIELMKCINYICAK